MRMFQRFLLIPLVCAVAFMVQGLTGSVASAAFDLTEGPVRYSSWDENDDEQTFVLSYESVPGVYAKNVPHGTYLVHNDIDGGSNDFSYDYDDGTYTIYMGDGATQKISYDEDNDVFYVEDLLDDADSGTYAEIEPSFYYTNSATGHYILPRIVMLIRKGYTLGDTFSAWTEANGWREFTIIEYPEDASSSDLPSKWYKLTDVSDPDEWVAFTYDTSNGVFTMYRPSYDGIEKYSYRKFIDDDTLQVRSNGSGVDTDTYTKTSNGKFAGENWYIDKYITDGMLIFKNDCLH